MKNSCSNEPLSVSGKNTLIISLEDIPKSLHTLKNMHVHTDFQSWRIWAEWMLMSLLLVMMSWDPQTGILFLSSSVNPTYPARSLSSILSSRKTSKYFLALIIIMFYSSYVTSTIISAITINITIIIIFFINYDDKTVIFIECSVYARLYTTVLTVIILFYYHNL